MTYPLKLSTDRLILREFTEDDWKATLAYQSDPRYLQFYSWTQRTEAEVQSFVGSFFAQQVEQPRRKFQLAITLRAGNHLIGSSGVRVHDVEGRQASLGYELDPIFWGRGLATEAAHAMLRFGFKELQMHRIFGECVADNAASIRVMKKLGMQQEAHLREATWFKGRWWDMCTYAVLEHEWQSANIPIS